ncbi:thymidylate synthase ThyX [Lachnospiraceae bacterium]|nr:thymidylate synthase ThyX [Lachnospiraceae bacterium]
MGKVIILEETTKNPLTLMGQRAGVCWGGDIEDPGKNYQRGLDCLRSGHGRVMEYVNVEMVLAGYSARVIREWYTHIGGLPTRLQASTRYINYQDFNCIMPDSVKNHEEAAKRFESCMEEVRSCIQFLTGQCGVPREDAALLLPLGMETKIVDKRNLRSIMDMCQQRLCSRANWEYRGLMGEICQELKKISEEWVYIVDNFFEPKCKKIGYCPEKKSCGLMEKKKDEIAE